MAGGTGARGHTPAWTPAEEAFVFDNYPVKGLDWVGWSVHLPGRTKKAIYERFRVMTKREERRKIPPHPWTDKERIELVKMVAPFCQRIGVSLTACGNQLKEIEADYNKRNSHA